MKKKYGNGYYYLKNMGEWDKKMKYLKNCSHYFQVLK